LGKATGIVLYRGMSESLQLPTLVHTSSLGEVERLTSYQTPLEDGEEKAETLGETALVDNNAIVDMTKNESNISERVETTNLPHTFDDVDANDTNMLPQMNVYVLDDTPSVTSQTPLSLTPLKDNAALGDSTGSEGYSGLLRTSPYKEPDTTLSLDKEEPVSDLDKSPPSDHDQHCALYNSFEAIHANDPMMISARADPDDHNNHNDDDSSNDDSSYFASHLPEPNSGRRYSWASNASQNSNTQQPNNTTTGTATLPTTNISTNRRINVHGRESDASLSLSDDSDDNMATQQHLPVSFGPQQVHYSQSPTQYYSQTYNQRLQQQQQQHPYSMQQPNQYQQSHQFYLSQQQEPIQFTVPSRRTGGVPELYPEQIMPRMHSVNSLASTSSHNSSGSDTSLPDELQNVVVRSSQRRQLSRGSSNTSNIPSGRRSPILGEHPPSRGSSQHLLIPPFGSPSTVNLQPSPPMILHSYSANGVSVSGGGNGTNDDGATIQQLPHPQPHLMTPEQLAAWTMTAMQGNQDQDRSIFPTKHQPISSLQHDSGIANYPNISGSRGESDFIYSGDSDSNVHHHQQQNQQQSSKHAFGEPMRGANNMMRISDVQSLRSLSWEQPLNQGRSIKSSGVDGGLDPESMINTSHSDRGFKVYWQRWIMLLYMSILNLLSDWTCYSVAPIALLTEEAFGEINAEQLVVVFLVANGMATACEPIILSRLGLRRTVLFGSLLLMIGSIIKSGGMPPIIQADLKKGEGEWRVYLGFFLVGLSQPLYQCTPALLSASWFPEAERTLATGVALNSNQLGIGFAFVFGTMLVETSDDIPKYFGLLSILSTLTFLGTLVQFDDAPPTPPSDTAKVMRGTLEAKLPSVQSIFESVRNMGVSSNPFDVVKQDTSRKNSSRKEKGRNRAEKYQRHLSEESKTHSIKTEDSEKQKGSEAQRRSSRRSSTSERRSSRRAAASGSNIARRRIVKKENTTTGNIESGFQAAVPSPSPALWGSVRKDFEETTSNGNDQAQDSRTPLMATNDVTPHTRQETQDQNMGNAPYYHHPPYVVPEYASHPGEMYSNYPMCPPQYQLPHWDPQYSQFVYYQQSQQPHYQFHQIPPTDPYISYQHSYPYQPYPFASYEPLEHLLPATEAIDEGAEPVITILPHHLDIHIRDDQIWLSTRACLARPGFIHSLVSFTVSGVVINTLSTFMDYLVRLNGAGREYTGIVGGTFQFVIMMSSLIVGKVCDKTRAYYSITIGMLVLGAFGLAECGVSLDSNSGVSLRWSLIIVALLVGPLQPVSTELGVDVVYPLSENTVLVIQQLFSNLLSAAFIPCFKAMKDVGERSFHDGTTERPSYTFSFYLLIVVHACATVFFATFNGRYLRYEHELERQAQEERRKMLQQRSDIALEH
jgi:Major Facilitator Superfamily